MTSANEARLVRPLYPLTALLLLSVAPAAMAGRPFTTEDAGVIDRGVCEVESFTEVQRERAAADPRAATAQ